jgi:hypothetical protein
VLQIYYKIEEENKPKAKYSSTGVKGKTSGNKTQKLFGLHEKNNFSCVSQVYPFFYFRPSLY